VCLPAKQFEVLKELIPDLTKPAILLNASNRLSDAHTAGDGSAKESSVDETAKIVLACSEVSI
jgi:hypothetical protein